MRRREFIALLGGAAGWPLTARAQEGERVRRIGVLLPAAATASEFEARVAAFVEGLQRSGWTAGRNVRIDTRWATTNVEDIRRHAAELVALAPAVILAHGAVSVRALLQKTRTLPIVFPVVVDPVVAGSVESLAPPGGNTTGFMNFEYGVSGKWLEFWRPLTANRIIALAARHELPTVYYEWSYVAAGGLISYGPDLVDQYRHAAGYVARILRGEQPAGMPVQAPTKYETVLNLKTAKALGLTIPPTLLADEVIE